MCSLQQLAYGMCPWGHIQYVCVCRSVCVCECACQHVWRRGGRVLWLAGVMPAPAERWAELFASSPISPSIAEQSDRPDSTIGCCISRISLSSPLPLTHCFPTLITFTPPPTYAFSPSHILHAFFFPPACPLSSIPPPSSCAFLTTALEFSGVRFTQITKKLFTVHRLVDYYD